MLIKRIALTCLVFASFAAVGHAHPGHGGNHSGYSFLHYATSPIHIVPIVIAAFLLAGAVKLFRKARQRTAG